MEEDDDDDDAHAAELDERRKKAASGPRPPLFLEEEEAAAEATPRLERPAVVVAKDATEKAATRAHRGPEERLAAAARKVAARAILAGCLEIRREGRVVIVRSMSAGFEFVREGKGEMMRAKGRDELSRVESS